MKHKIIKSQDCKGKDKYSVYQIQAITNTLGKNIPYKKLVECYFSLNQAVENYPDAEQPS